MKVPAATNPNWHFLIKGERKVEIKFLGTKIILNRIILTYRLNPTEEVMSESIEELIIFFQKNVKIPKVQEDIIKIFGTEANS